MITQPTVNPILTALTDEDLTLLAQYDQQQISELLRQLASIYAQLEPLEEELVEIALESDFRMGLELEYGFEPDLSEPDPEQTDAL